LNESPEGASQERAVSGGVSNAAIESRDSVAAILPAAAAQQPPLVPTRVLLS
jgi:hypothetical protein